MIGVVFLAAVVRDLLDEVRFRRRHGEVETVVEIQRLELLGPVREALESRAIPVLFAGLWMRSLLHVFGPLVPVRVLVPPQELERARDVVLPEVWREAPTGGTAAA